MRFEIRRLHEAFGITTLYVTHDLAEAMVISDRVAVLHRGRVALVGAVADLFESSARPTSWRRWATGRAWRRGTVCACAWPARPSREVRASRCRSAPTPSPLVDDGAAGPPGANVLAGVIERATYLGDAVDYHVRVDGTDLVLRASAPPGRRRQPGDRVPLAVTPEACVPVAGDEA
jgi:TOBE domain